MNRNTARTLPASVGYVYIVRSGDRVKIGKSKMPEERIKTIGNSAGVHIDEHFVSTLHEGYSQTETKLHERFAASRGIGEWFGATFSEVVGAAQTTAAAEITPQRLLELRNEEKEAGERFLNTLVSTFMPETETGSQEAPEEPSLNSFEEFIAEGKFYDITAGDIALMVANGWVSKNYVIYTAEEIATWKF